MYCAKLAKAVLLSQVPRREGLKIAAFLAKLDGFYASLNIDLNGLMLTF